MAYYHKYQYNLSYHGASRIRKRLNLPPTSDTLLSQQVNTWIESSHELQETKQHLYVRYINTNMYFIISKKENLIITLTPISPEKWLIILEND